MSGWKLLLLVIVLAACEEASQRPSTVPARTAAAPARPDTTNPQSATPNCAEAEFYSAVANYVSRSTPIIQAVPTKDPYQTAAQHGSQVRAWRPATRKTLDSLAVELGTIAVTAPVLRSHYDADKQRVFIDSVPPLPVPGVRLSSSMGGIVQFPVIACVARPFLDCRRATYGQQGREYSVSEHWSAMVLHHDSRGSPPSFSVPVNEARAADVVNANLKVRFDFRFGHREYPSVDRFGTPIPDALLFGPAIFLAGAQLLADGKPIAEQRLEEPPYDEWREGIYKEFLVQWRPKPPSCPSSGVNWEEMRVLQAPPGRLAEIRRRVFTSREPIEVDTWFNSVTVEYSGARRDANTLLISFKLSKESGKSFLLVSPPGIEDEPPYIIQDDGQKSVCSVADPQPSRFGQSDNMQIMVPEGEVVTATFSCPVSGGRIEKVTFVSPRIDGAQQEWKWEVYLREY
jgi:hypothetical protein